MRNYRGFTLIELMVTIAVLASIAMLAAPSFTQLRAKQQLNANSRDLIATISKARNQAVFLRTNTTVFLSSGVNTETNYYWQTTANNSVTAPTSITQIVFNRDGSISSGISADTSFVICNSTTRTTKAFALTKMGSVYPKSDGTC